MKFKLDENMPKDLCSLLHEEGHDVHDVIAEGLAGKDDPTVLAIVTREGRILVTYDLDFADIRHFPPGSHAGIVVFRLEDQRWKTLEEPEILNHPNAGRLLGVPKQSPIINADLKWEVSPI